MLVAVVPALGDEKPTKTEAQKYNDAIELANRRLFSAGQSWASKAGFLREEPTDLAALKAEHTKLLKTVQEVAAEMKALKVPPGKSSEQLAKAHQEFMEFQQRVVDRAIKPVMAIAEDKSLTETQKQKKALEILEKEFAGEQQLTEQLQRAQKAFLDEHGLTPMPNNKP